MFSDRGRTAWHWHRRRPYRAPMISRPRIIPRRIRSLSPPPGRTLAKRKTRRECTFTNPKTGIARAQASKQNGSRATRTHGGIPSPRVDLRINCNTGTPESKQMPDNRATKGGEGGVNRIYISMWNPITHSTYCGCVSVFQTATASTRETTVRNAIMIRER